MLNIKICPDCRTEYNPHIENCADCGAPLMVPDEVRNLHEERKQCMERLLQNPVSVKEGNLQLMKELYKVLINSDIPCTVNADTCTKSCCGDKYQLLVSSEDAERAVARVADHYAEVDPEFKSARDNISQGKCPACETPVGEDTVECPDCGLTLLIVE